MLGGMTGVSTGSLMTPQRTLPAPQAASVVMGGVPSVQLEIGGYPRPDIDQMIPFKPKANSAASFHPVPGGVFPPPPAIAELISMLPPPWTFQGPFVSVDMFIEHISKTQLTVGPIIDKKVKVENGTMVGPMRVDDVRKEMYQLLATTPDPRFVSIILFFFSKERVRISEMKALESFTLNEHQSTRRGPHCSKELKTLSHCYKVLKTKISVVGTVP
ncbi:unnamed protein product [Cylicostephanus goldi]|uniref:Uncharacterized protein n=1 Tax=Cylicostephanus goldi TaxID=71465 RepID=A0A3P6R251_CYLGO|nr:unnamed protein product [Cylicostephanus goldi]